MVVVIRPVVIYKDISNRAWCLISVRCYYQCKVSTGEYCDGGIQGSSSSFSLQALGNSICLCPYFSLGELEMLHESAKTRKGTNYDINLQYLKVTVYDIAKV